MAVGTSVIIITKGNLSGLKLLIKSLYDQTAPKDSFDVMVVDCSEDTETDHYLKDTPFLIEVNCCAPRENTAAAARNTGVAQTDGDRVLFLTDSMIAPPGLIDNHLAAHRSNPRRVVRGPIFPLAYNGEIPIKPLPVKAAPLFFSVWNCSFPKMALAKTEGFQDARSDYEDVEIYWRLIKEGYPEFFTGDCYCYQDSTVCRGRGLDVIKAQASVMARSAVQYYIKKNCRESAKIIGKGLGAQLKAMLRSNSLIYSISRSLRESGLGKNPGMRAKLDQRIYEYYYRRALVEEMRVYGL